MVKGNVNKFETLKDGKIKITIEVEKEMAIEALGLDKKNVNVVIDETKEKFRGDGIELYLKTMSEMLINATSTAKHIEHLYSVKKNEKLNFNGGEGSGDADYKCDCKPEAGD